MRRVALVALGCAGAAVGVLAEQQGYSWSDFHGWLPDLFAGWTLIGLGLALIARRADGAAGLLLAAGFTWFAFNFEGSGVAAFSWLAVHAVYLHRAPLFHLALALPAGRPRTRVAGGGVVLAWTAAVAWPLWDRDGTALVLGAAFVVIAAVGWRDASGRSGRAIAARGLFAAAVLGAAIGADAVRSSAGATQGVADVTIVGYDLAVALAGVALFAASRLAVPASLAERAIALESSGRGLRDALRDLLGDPDLEIELDSDSGRPDGPVVRADGHVATPVIVAGERVGTVVHDPATLEDPVTREAVLAAVGLAAERARLRAELGRQVDAVEASRLRLLLAEEEERRRLAERIERGAGAELTRVERLTREASREAGSESALGASLDRATEQLGRVRPELDALVGGLGGVDARGLSQSLERLAGGLPLEVNLELAELVVAPEVSSTLWFVCSEGLANAVKHGEATTVRVELVEENRVARLVVEDDGRGGADPTGSGLVGLADRVSALGGRLVVTSPPGRGTRLVAELPLADDRPVDLGGGLA